MRPERRGNEQMSASIVHIVYVSVLWKRSIYFLVMTPLLVDGTAYMLCYLKHKTKRCQQVIDEVVAVRGLASSLPTRFSQSVSAIFQLVPIFH